MKLTYLLFYLRSRALDRVYRRFGGSGSLLLSRHVAPESRLYLSCRVTELYGVEDECFRDSRDFSSSFEFISDHMCNRLPLSSAENSSCNCSFVGSFVDSEGALSGLRQRFVVRSDSALAVSDTLKLFLAWCPRKAACIFVAAASSFSLPPSASSSFSLSSEDSVFVALSSAAFEISSKRSN